MLIVNTIGPIAAIVAVGWALRHYGFAPERFFREANRLVYWVGLPCLLFVKVTESQGGGRQAMVVSAVMIVTTLVTIGMAYGSGALLGLRRGGLGSFVQGSYRGNLAYVGLSIILFAGDGLGLTDTPGLEKMAVLALVPVVPVYNAAAVLVLVAGQEHREANWGVRLGRLLLRVLGNPLIIACALGLAWSLTPWELPPLVRRSVAGIGQMALPLALLGIGASLNLARLHGRRLPAVVGALLKVAVTPLIGWGIAAALGLEPTARLVAVLYLACPTAVASFVMAQQLEADEHLAGAIVVLSTVLAMPTMAVILAVST